MSAQTPPLDPLLIPDSPLNQKQEVTEKPSKAVLTLPSLVTSEDLAQMRSMDVEEAIRASAFLLDWASVGGSNEVSGPLALGIAQALRLCADKIQGDRE